MTSADSPRDSVQFIEWSPTSCPRALLISNFHGRVTIWTQPSQVSELYLRASQCMCLVNILEYLTPLKWKSWSGVILQGTSVIINCEYTFNFLSYPLSHFRDVESYFSISFNLFYFISHLPISAHSLFLYFFHIFAYVEYLFLTLFFHSGAN